MRCFNFGFARLAQTVTAALLAVVLVPAAAQAAVFSFSVQPPNTATDSDGNVIRVTAGGIFDTVTRDILVMGSYTVVDADGAVVERGTWEATKFVKFSSFGGPSPGFQAGVLDMKVTLCSDAGDTCTDVRMRIVCNLPDFDTGKPAGTTVGRFKVLSCARGRVLCPLQESRGGRHDTGFEPLFSSRGNHRVRQAVS